MAARNRWESLCYTAAMPSRVSLKPHSAVVLFVCLSAFCLHLSAQSPAAHPSESFRQLVTAFTHGQYFPKRPAQFQWLDGGKRYTLLEPSAATDKGQDLVSYDTASGGDRTVLVSAASFIPKGSTTPLEVEGYDWSSDHSRLLVFTNSKKVWRRNTRGDFWVPDIQSKSLTQLGGAAAPA